MWSNGVNGIYVFSIPIGGIKNLIIPVLFFFSVAYTASLKTSLILTQREPYLSILRVAFPGP